MKKYRAVMDIKKIRTKLKMTQNDFVDALNGVMINMRVGDVRHIDRTQISGWETGRRNPDKLIQEAIKKMLKNGG